MKKRFLLLLVAIVASAQIFSVEKIAKVILLDGGSVDFNMKGIQSISVVDSVYPKLTDSLYTCIESGPWYLTSYKVTWSEKSPWEVASFTPNKNNIDTYKKNSYVAFEDNVTTKGFYYIEPNGKHLIRKDNLGNTMLYRIVKLTKTELEMIFYYEEGKFFIWMYMKHP
jgi:hypothetical protein